MNITKTKKLNRKTSIKNIPIKTPYKNYYKMSLVIYHRDFNPDRVVINGKCKLAKNNPSKRVYVNYGNKKAPLMLSSPKMRLPYGLSDYDPSKFNQPGEIKYYFESSFAGMEGWKDGDNKELAQFYSNIQKVDDKLWQAALLNQKDWFGKTTLTDAMRELVLTPSIRKNFDKKGEEYPPTIRQKLMENNDEDADVERLHKFDCTVYDKDNKEIAITHADIPKGSDARFIVQLTGAVITNGKLHPVWKCCQVKLYTSAASAKLSGPAFFTESDSDDNDFSDEDDHADTPVATADHSIVIMSAIEDITPVAASPEGESESDSDPDTMETAAPAPITTATAKKAPAARVRKGAK